MMVHSHPSKILKENHLQNLINPATQSWSPKEFMEKACQMHEPFKSNIMWLPVTAAAANMNPPGDCYGDESQEAETSKQVYWTHGDQNGLSGFFAQSESNFPMVHFQWLPFT